MKHFYHDDDKDGGYKEEDIITHAGRAAFAYALRQHKKQVGHDYERKDGEGYFENAHLWVVAVVDGFQFGNIKQIFRPAGSLFVFYKMVVVQEANLNAFNF